VLQYKALFLNLLSYIYIYKTDAASCRSGVCFSLFSQSLV
jgi:hypothetical protein